MFFSGQYEHKIDSQGRVSIPVRFRDAFKAGIILTQGFEQCIFAYTPGEWESMASKVSQMPFTQAKSRRMMRLTFWQAFQLDMDRQGRVPLPASLREYSNADEEVVIAGTGLFLEIWNKDKWAEQSLLLNEAAWQIAENTEVRE